MKFKSSISFLLPFLLLSGCSTLASKEATVACQVADDATTVYALNHGAVESGIFLSGASVGPILIFGIAWLGVKLYLHDHLSETSRATLNVISCGAGIHNANVIRVITR